jgi:hypothetical protein
MRPRKQIEDYVDEPFGYYSSKYRMDRATLDVLLDIRDLLQKHVNKR